MSTFEHKISDGMVLMCGECKGPARKHYYTHECKGSLKDKVYCAQCIHERMVLKIPCRRCGLGIEELSYFCLSPHSKKNSSLVGVTIGNETETMKDEFKNMWLEPLSLEANSLYRAYSTDDTYNAYNTFQYVDTYFPL